MGQLMFDLGKAELKAGSDVFSYSTFVVAFLRPWQDAATSYGKITAKDLQAVIDEIDGAMEPWSQVKMQCDDADLIKAEIENAVLLAKAACRYGIIHLQSEDYDVTKGDVKQRTRLLDDLQERIIPEHRRLWLLRNRPGGLEERSVPAMSRTFRFLKKVHLARRLWEWNPSLVSEEWQEIEFELPKDLWEAPVNVQFLYASGGAALAMRRVALVVDGTEEAQDKHDGLTGGAKKQNIYNLPAVLPTGAQSVIVRASIRACGSNDSYGVVSAESATTSNAL